MLRHTLRFAHVASGARIAWASSGCAGAPVLVRAAHWMTHVDHDPRSPIWQPWLERLGQRLEVVRYDERGCGMSGRDDVPPGLGSALEELEVVIDAHGASQVSLLGISGAAPTAIAYAARHPERVAKLVILGGYLLGSALRDPDPAGQAFRDAQLRLIEFGWGRRGHAVQQFFTTTMVPDATLEQAAALNEQQRLSCDGARAAAIVRSRMSLDVRELASQVRCPTLVMHAERDAMVPLEAGVEVAAAIPDARFERLPTRNHVPLSGDAAFERMCALLDEFVAGGVGLPPLTVRERATLEALAQGLDNAQIAARLQLAEKTVRNAVSALYRKLGVEGRAQAIVRAREHGLGADGRPGRRS